MSPDSRLSIEHAFQVGPRDAERTQQFLGLLEQSVHFCLLGGESRAGGVRLQAVLAKMDIRPSLTACLR